MVLPILGVGAGFYLKGKLQILPLLRPLNCTKNTKLQNRHQKLSKIHSVCHLNPFQLAARSAQQLYVLKPVMLSLVPPAPWSASTSRTLSQLLRLPPTAGNPPRLPTRYRLNHRRLPCPACPKRRSRLSRSGRRPRPARSRDAVAVAGPVVLQIPIACKYM